MVMVLIVKKNAPIVSGRWVSLVFLIVWFWFLNLSYAPTSRHLKDTGAIIVGIISAIQVRGKVHISRKHTTVKGMRQARANKIPIKD